MTCMDEFHQNIAGSDGAASDMDTSQSSDAEKIKPAEGYVIVIGATNRPDAVDRALRRLGRFDREICVGVPDEDARRQILERLTRSLRTPVEGGQFDLDKIARATPGFIGADLKALVNQAGSQPIDRIVDVKMNENGPNWWRHPCSQNEMESLSVTMDDFEVIKSSVIFQLLHLATCSSRINSSAHVKKGDFSRVYHV